MYQDQRKEQIDGILEITDETVKEMRSFSEGGVGGIAFLANRLEKQAQDLKAITEKYSAK